MPKRRANLRDDCSGASAVEFALLIGPFLLIVFGSIEFARLGWAHHAIAETAAASARCVGILASACATNGVYDAGKATLYAQAQAERWSLVLPNDGVAVTNATACGGVDGFSEVSITYTFQTAVPALIQALASGTIVKHTACFPRAI